MKLYYKFYWSKLLKYFGQGLLFVVPIALTTYTLVYLFNIADNLLHVGIPGLGIIIIVVFTTLVGFFGPRLLSNPIFDYITKAINKTPIVKIIYTSIRDLLSAFVGNKKKFTEPVLVKLSASMDVQQMGFLTQNDLSFMGIEGKKVSVYIPFSYSIMGTVYIVPAENITKLNISPTDTMKFIVSGGVTQSSSSPEEEV